MKTTGLLTGFARPEGDKEFSLVLREPAGVATVGSAVKVKIRDDEPRFETIYHGATSDYTGVTLHHPTNELWRVEASSDLKTWTRQGLARAPGGFDRDHCWTDNNAAGHQARFYRAVKE